jgi:hypothetical protein
MRRIRWSCSLLTLGLACLPLALSAPLAQAVTVRVSPADTTVILNTTFSVRVVCDAFPDLKAYQLIFQKGSTILQYLGATAGEILTSAPGSSSVQELPDVVPPVDSLWVDCAQLRGSTSGPGVLIYFNFKAVATGVCPLDCLQVDFRDSMNNPTLPACFGGIVRVESPVPVVPASWGRMKLIYR